MVRAAARISGQYTPRVQQRASRDADAELRVEQLGGVGDDRERQVVFRLDLLVAEWVLRDVDPSPPPDPEWTDKVKTMVFRVRDQVGNHPQTVPLLIANRQRSRALLRWSETVLAVLTEAGFTGTSRVVAMRSLLGYLNGALLQEQLGPLAGPATLAMAALPAGEFPLTRETARAARDVDPQAEFAGGLAILLRGLAVSRPGPAPGDRP